MPEREKPVDISGRTEVASYVAAISIDLAAIARRNGLDRVEAIARRNGLDTIGYLLEMVHLEAESTIRHIGQR